MLIDHGNRGHVNGVDLAPNGAARATTAYNRNPRISHSATLCQESKYLAATFIEDLTHSMMLVARSCDTSDLIATFRH